MSDEKKINKNLNETDFYTNQDELFINKYTLKTSDIDISLFFTNITDEIIIKIKKSTAVIGCVAWLTNFNIINALSEVKNGASIIIQKESFTKKIINIKKCIKKLNH